MFAAKEINFLGHKISADGVKPTLDNIDAIQKLQTPTNVTELASFLGTCNFYLEFIPHYADVAEPLRKLLCKDVPWEWGTSQAQVYDSLKEKISSPQVLAHSDPDASTYATTGASGTGIGAVLS